MFRILLAFAALTGVAFAAGPVPADIEQVLGPKLSPGASMLFPDDGVEFVNNTSRFSQFHTATAAAVVNVHCEQDVVNTVKYAVRNNVTFLTQNAGHGWDVELGRIQNALFLNVRALNHISIDTKNNRATVGGGVIANDLIEELYKRGKEVSTTVCYCPGVVGATLGGGVGRLMGRHGLMLDSVLSMRVVLPDGSLRVVSATQNPDLFWAMRGAGHNFGVVTELTFKIYDQVQDGLHLNLDMIFPPEQIEEVFEVANELVPVIDPEVAFAVVYSTMEDEGALKPIVLVNWVYAGPAAEGLARAQKFLDMKPLIADNTSYPWNELSAKGVQRAVVEFCTRGGRNNMFNIGLKEYNPEVQREIYDLFVGLLQDYPAAANTSILFQSYSQQASRRVDPASTAYAHRAVNNNLLIDAWYFDASIDDAVTAWGSNIRSKLHAVSGFGNEEHVYINFAHGDESLEAKYGYEPWRLQKLRNLKKKYDPTGAFNGYHPITL